jgi:hypothetical protein
VPQQDPMDLTDLTDLTGSTDSADTSMTEVPSGEVMEVMGGGEATGVAMQTACRGMLALPAQFQAPKVNKAKAYAKMLQRHGSTGGGDEQKRAQVVVDVRARLVGQQGQERQRVREWCAAHGEQYTTRQRTTSPALAKHPCKHLALTAARAGPRCRHWMRSWWRRATVAATSNWSEAGA